MQQAITARQHLDDTDDWPGLGADLEVDHPEAATALLAVLGDRRALADAALGGSEDRPFLLDPCTTGMTTTP